MDRFAAWTAVLFNSIVSFRTFFVEKSGGDFFAADTLVKNRFTLLQPVYQDFNTKNSCEDLYVS